jgi:hypothetical protein
MAPENPVWASNEFTKNFPELKYLQDFLTALPGLPDSITRTS